MQIFDSQFSQYLKEYFPEDKLIRPEKTIATELEKIESPSTKLFIQTFDRAIDAAVTQLQSAIANKDPEAVQKYKWNLNIGLANNIFGEWLLGWQTGSERGRSEVASYRIQRTGVEQGRETRPLTPDKTSEFNQPEPQSDILRNRLAEAAIKARVNTLAKDVSDSEWQEIKGIILDAIKPTSPTENPISRKELLKRINEQLGERKTRFKNRAERIARTELTFAYNAGRLDSYVRSGLVAGVRYQTIFDERRCPICASRQGIVVSLDDIEKAWHDCRYPPIPCVAASGVPY